jgi:hypothetical protein
LPGIITPFANGSAAGSESAGTQRPVGQGAGAIPVINFVGFILHDPTCQAGIMSAPTRWGSSIATELNRPCHRCPVTRMRADIARVVAMDVAKGTPQPVLVAGDGDDVSVILLQRRHIQCRINFFVRNEASLGTYSLDEIQHGLRDKLNLTQYRFDKIYRDILAQDIRPRYQNPPLIDKTLTAAKSLI